MDYFHAHYLGYGTNTRSPQIILKVVTDVVLMYRGEGFAIHNILCDNEQVLIALNPSLGALCIKLITAGIKSNHITSLDRKIRLLKDLVRSILASLPFNLPNLLMKYAVKFAIYNINLLTHSHDSGMARTWGQCIRRFFPSSCCPMMIAYTERIFRKIFAGRC